MKKEEKTVNKEEDEEECLEPESVNRQIQVIKSSVQVLLSTEDPNEDIAFLVQKATEIIDKYK